MRRFVCLPIVFLLILATLVLPTSERAPAWAGEAGELAVHFIDVGQGDATWLSLPDGRHVLVDGGPPQAGPTVVAYMRERGVEEIHLLVATHGHADHIGGLPHLLTELPVAEAWLDGNDCATQTCLAFYQSLADYQVVTATVRMGETYAWGEVGALVLNPSEPLYANRNENSVVLRVTHGAFALLLTGDAESGAEGRMLADGHPLQADILRVAHHGSATSSSAAFLAAVSPAEAIIPVGINSYGHPHADTLARLEAAGARVWRADRDGSIIVTTRGMGYTIRPAALRTLYLPLVLRGMAMPTTQTNGVDEGDRALTHPADHTDATLSYPWVWISARLTPRPLAPLATPGY